MNPSKEKELEDVKRHVSQHVKIAIGLAIASLLTLWTSQTDFGNHSLNVAMTLGIAVAQAFMVAAFFMHLLSEQKVIYCFLVFTAVFFAVMMVMFILSHMPSNIIHYQ